MQLASVPRLVNKEQLASQWFLEHKRSRHPSEIITSVAQAAPATGWGLPQKCQGFCIT